MSTFKQQFTLFTYFYKNKANKKSTVQQNSFKTAKKGCPAENLKRILYKNFIFVP